MASTSVDSLEALHGLVGTHLGYSAWLTITQERIDQFAEATGDHQWIHVDPVRAASGPFGTTIAHGYLTLSLVSALLPEVLDVRGVGMVVNYGANRIRFPAPVPVGSRVRLGAVLASLSEIAGGAQSQVDVTIEVEGSTKPALVAEILFRYYQV
ncbi:MaoC domain protein dehydratase [Acidimicrobium ferrooxidans DSM 10331]|uniref:MaoC domain protein dehydratase n=1 Tax=Acidimicrobium ferrooxidans (strain DSM 10331 / JCM 15462 / NBRC 103882 / ICP) TaxID=525909 RepID=C7LYH7_ACIFD|nr:MaoC family dehydratase [Acidimicrobium ferrooxidans]ACU53785.1 MaoC domain protein dehydratase [Acidimicrobium ferrooxidans DSM 10331]